MGQTKKRSYDRYTLAYKLQAIKLANHSDVKSKDIAEKAELIHPEQFEHEIEVVVRIVEYIEFYNCERLHPSLGYQPPVEYEKLCA